MGKLKKNIIKIKAWFTARVQVQPGFSNISASETIAYGRWTLNASVLLNGLAAVTILNLISNHIGYSKYDELVESLIIACSYFAYGALSGIAIAVGVASLGCFLFGVLYVKFGLIEFIQP